MSPIQRQPMSRSNRVHLDSLHNILPDSGGVKNFQDFKKLINSNCLFGLSRLRIYLMKITLKLKISIDLECVGVDPEINDLRNFFKNVLECRKSNFKFNVLFDIDRLYLIRSFSYLTVPK